MKYPAITLPDMFDGTVAKSPSETALIYFGGRISYAQLRDHVNRLAAGLQKLAVRSQKGHQKDQTRENAQPVNRPDHPP